MLESSLGCTLQTKDPFLHSIAQVYTGSCQSSFHRASTIRDLKISTAPLRQFALEHGIERLSLSSRLPDLEITETQPVSSTQSLLVGRMPASSQHFSELTHQYFWQIGSAIPEEVTVRFGFSASSVRRAEYVLLGVLLFPALLVFWMGRKALSSEAQDKAVVWFAYMRYLNWTLNLSLLGWWIAADSLHILKLLQLLQASVLSSVGLHSDTDDRQVVSASDYMDRLPSVIAPRARKAARAHVDASRTSYAGHPYFLRFLIAAGLVPHGSYHPAEGIGPRWHGLDGGRLRGLHHRQSRPPDVSRHATPCPHHR